MSLLARYPEIAMVRFSPKKRALWLTFLVSGEVKRKAFRSLATRLQDAVGVYSSLKAKEPRSVKLKLSTTQSVSVIEVERDVETLDSEEISLVTALVSDHFGDRLILDGEDSQQATHQEEMLLQEEIIEEMLDSIRQAGARRGFVAVREEGQVVVFNK